ncbi:hypothetical protein AOC03_12445 (plasmid) [Psychrobacter urativorans]|uniref:Uncharacterized protein n=1 Tax=Psychrobacter urativorans TaxID=45610 RepID=A0A0M4U8V5_9GAMM|nr:hypothetical protein AOC03_12445 [Psychrobacter urativorans]
MRDQLKPLQLKLMIKYSSSIPLASALKPLIDKSKNNEANNRDITQCGLLSKTLIALTSLVKIVRGNLPLAYTQIIKYLNDNSTIIKLVLVIK